MRLWRIAARNFGFAAHEAYHVCIITFCASETSIQQHIARQQLWRQNYVKFG
jgi:hypothetical protein